MKITEFVKPSTVFLKAQDVKSSKNPLFVIMNEGNLVDNEFKGKKSQRLHLEGEFEGKNVILDLSKTNARIISDKIGDETDKWVGRVLTLEIYKTKTSDGVLTDAINVAKVE